MKKKCKKTEWKVIIYLICIIIILIFRFLPCSITLQNYAEKIALFVQYGKKRVHTENIYMINWQHHQISTKEKLKLLPSLTGDLIMSIPYAVLLLLMGIMTYLEYKK
jgi:hypothetical protein